MEVDEASNETLVTSSEVGSKNGVVLEGDVGVKDDLGDGVKRGFEFVASAVVGSENGQVWDKDDGVQRGFDIVVSAEVGSETGVILEGEIGAIDEGVERGSVIVVSAEVGSETGVILEGEISAKDEGVERGSDIGGSDEVGSENGVILDGDVGVNDDTGDGVNRGFDIGASDEVGSENGVILEGDVGVNDDTGDGVKRGSDLVASAEVGSKNGVILGGEVAVEDDRVGWGFDIGDVDKEMKSGDENDNGLLVLHSVSVLGEDVGSKGSGDDSGGSEDDGGEGLRRGDDSENRSLLKEMNKKGVTRKKRKKYFVDDDKSDDDDESDDDDDIGDQSCEYRVGDFVWGKIRSYPWWPGQIYSAADASEYALNLKQKDRFLVAYFGDGSFSWCNPSQLKPFVENFKVMSEQTNSKNFMYAVEAALDEVSRVVELQMTCSCLAEKNGKLEPSMASNSGLKVGVLVPVGVGKSFIAQCEPEKLINSLRNYAETVTVKNLLELTVMKSWLTVYCRAKGGYPLPLYHYPRGIEGLEDKSGNPVKTSVQGPNGEELLSAPVEAVGSGVDLPNQSLLQKCSETSSDVLYQRRKQKSVAELIEDEMRKEESFVNESVSNVLSTGKRGRRQKAVASRSPRTEGEKIATCESNDFGEKEADETHPSGGQQNKILSGGESEGEEETAKSTRLRERKRSKYLSAPFTNPSQIMKISSFKRDSETESMKNSRVGERMARVAGQLIGLQSCCNETSQTGPPIGKGNNNAKSEKSDVEFIKENISSFRNKVQQKGEPGSMKRKPEHMFQLIENGSNGQELKTPPAKKAASGCETVSNNEDAREATPVALMLTFPPAFPLPSRDELMKIFGKFGPLNDDETCLLYKSFSARVSYLRSSDAEEAYKASKEKNPFGEVNVNYCLRYLSVSAKASERNHKSSVDHGKATQPCNDEATQLGLIREKLKRLSSIVESYGGRISVEMKSNLESEAKVLLEKVSSMTVTSS
ncbi:PWWP domain-containing protein [Heracleum sosnowskyi]|uniref:PWWP domain-containing protein n=1 Tax=Heracleum sosnowskyi TaxID=360622 RepID=A0AAD8HLL6_9APIA|nr:PWWP domain-containing protein [Heracleum sosnowskyi]